MEGAGERTPEPWSCRLMDESLVGVRGEPASVPLALQSRMEGFTLTRARENALHFKNTDNATSPYKMASDLVHGSLASSMLHRLAYCMPYLLVFCQQLGSLQLSKRCYKSCVIAEV
jgi:hypothetical protein